MGRKEPQPSPNSSINTKGTTPKPFGVAKPPPPPPPPPASKK